MRHQIRFTLEKISRRLNELEELVYRNRKPISPFYYLELETSDLPAPL